LLCNQLSYFVSDFFGAFERPDVKEQSERIRLRVIEHCCPSQTPASFACS
jgi:hypothetical protein